mmetsp:Transcript_60398/g.143975  ORF Transcript_60398/g.143975 Transcript_60398/m.143975 type:complete len:336 (-) Transcript_60398:124-1131(-)
MPKKGKQEKQYVGTIKSFNAEKGYGFISCKECFDEFNRDVFLHQQQKGLFEKGNNVHFVVKLNPQGCPQAYNLKPASSLEAWLAMPDTPEASSPSCSPTAVAAVEVYHGQVKSFNSVKGFGFIACKEIMEQHQKDVYLHSSQFEGRDLRIGDPVSFTVQFKNSHPQAHDVKKASAPATSSDAGALLREEIEGSGGNETGTLQARRPRGVSEELRNLAPEVLTKRCLRACASALTTSPETMESLLAAKADPNGIDVTGQRALMVAALNDRHSEKKVRLLLSNRADPHAAYKDGTVLDWIRERLSSRFAKFVEAAHQGSEDADVDIVLDNGLTLADD